MRWADLVAVLDGLGLLQEGLEGGPVHGLPLHAAGRDRVQDPQQHIAVPQRLHQVLDVDLVVQQAQQPHPEGALLPRVLPRAQSLLSMCRAMPATLSAKSKTLYSLMLSPKMAWPERCPGKFKQRGPS